MEYEGSFVRESTLVPVIPSASWREGMTLDEAKRHLVPMSLSRIVELKPLGELVVDEEHPDRVSKRVVDERSWGRRENVLRKVLSSKFIAFLVEGSYCEDLGLVVRYGKSPELL